MHVKVVPFHVVKFVISTTLFVGDTPIARNLLFSELGDSPTVIILIVNPEYLGHKVLSLTSTLILLNVLLNLNSYFLVYVF